ncbi:hypothetical protein LTR48_007288, partial [Friedmanniomyces endolithicus]
PKDGPRDVFATSIAGKLPGGEAGAAEKGGLEDAAGAEVVRLFVVTGVALDDEEDVVACRLQGRIGEGQG